MVNGRKGNDMAANYIKPEIGKTYKEKTFDTRHEASEWVRENERFFPDWHLRIVGA